MTAGDTLPRLCPKCEADWPWKWCGYCRVRDELIWRCLHCGHEKWEEPLDRRRKNEIILHARER